ncbi:MAG: S1C family serine protease [Planctomycetota bacterium]
MPRGLSLGDYRRTERLGQEVVWGPLSDVRTGFETVLQHDTVLKPEHCGGPLIDLEGRAIGLNISRAVRVETLALPAQEVQRLVQSLLPTSQQAKAPAP